ncbi:MAG: TonB family protein [Candidatus Omnitrophica bacterium]|nr:TonB family protein [Candidatus Omnitrophota bacterium]
MTGALRTALALSVGIHAGAFLGWPIATSVEFDVERAPTSLEIRLVAPRATPVSPHTVTERPVATVQPEPAADVTPEPEPVPVTIVAPESQGALGEVLPGYLRNPAPVYPMLARQRGEEGTVLLRVQVLPTGRCGQVVVLSSSGSALLDAAAVQAVQQWQFKPARRGAATVAVWVEIPIIFQLIDAGGQGT